MQHLFAKTRLYIVRD